MTRFPIIWFWALLLVTACATNSPEPAAGPGGIPDMVWPSPPRPARIRLERVFGNAKDLGHHQSISSRMKKVFAGGDERRMGRPYSIAVDASMVAIADPSSAIVHLFQKKKKTYRHLLKVGQYNLVSPIGVALGVDRIYIADSGLKMVFMLNSRFKLMNTLEGFQRPTGLAFDRGQQRLYVTDTLAHEIHVFNHAGDRLFKFGKNGKEHGQFNYPSHISYAKDRLFVNDTMNFRIQIFNGDGQYLSSFGDHGVGQGYMAQPKGVAIDSEGHIYIADAVENHVQIFNQEGRFLLSFGSEGNGPGSFQMPAGLAIWNDKIYVADSLNSRVQVFKYLQGEP